MTHVVDRPQNGCYNTINYPEQRTYLIVTASRTIITPTRNMATHTPPIMYKLSLGASENKIHLLHNAHVTNALTCYLKGHSLSFKQKIQFNVEDGVL